MLQGLYMRNGILLGVFFLSQFAHSQQVRLKTNREYFASMEASTNVDGRNQLIRSYYIDRNSTLPQTGKLNELSTLGLATALGLSSLFCDKMINVDSMEMNTANRWVHSSIDFELSPDQAFSPSIKKEILNTYAELFWQRKLTAEELTIFELMMDDFTANLPKAPASTKLTLVSTCAVFSTSIESLIALSI
jgi:hypothetical protein